MLSSVIIVLKEFLEASLIISLLLILQKKFVPYRLWLAAIFPLSILGAIQANLPLPHELEREIHKLLAEPLTPEVLSALQSVLGQHTAVVGHTHSERRVIADQPSLSTHHSDAEQHPSPDCPPDDPFSLIGIEV